MSRSSLGAWVGLLLLSASLSALAQARHAALFRPLPASAMVKAGSDPALRGVVAEPTTASVQLLEADVQQVTQERLLLEFDLAPGQRLTATRRLASRNADGTLTWVGSAGTDPLADSLILVRNGRKLTGTIRAAGKLYRIQPVKVGHALIEIDQSRLPPDHPADYRPIPILPLPDVSSQKFTPVTQSDPSVIRVMVVITDAAAIASGDPAGLINLAVAETNAGYLFSRIAIRMELAGWYQTAYAETGNFNTDLQRFQGTADGFLDEFHATRNAIAADVNVLINNSTQYCGLGYLNVPAEYAFSVVYRGCATGNYTFAHEIGHNQGAHHDTLNGTNANFAYGHGFQSLDQTWRTIMAYACSSTFCPKVNGWSNPKRIYRGVSMGTPGRNDNHRVLNETRFRVAGFR